MLNRLKLKWALLRMKYPKRDILSNPPPAVSANDTPDNRSETEKLAGFINETLDGFGRIMIFIAYATMAISAFIVYLLFFA